MHKTTLKPTAKASQTLQFQNKKKSSGNYKTTAPTPTTQGAAAS